jgi:hypothetical protein
MMVHTGRIASDGVSHGHGRFSLGQQTGGSNGNRSSRQIGIAIFNARTDEGNLTSAGWWPLQLVCAVLRLYLRAMPFSMTRRDAAAMSGSLLSTLLARPRATHALPAAPELGRDVADATLPPFSARGDGTSDDAAAIQAAVDALPRSGGTVLLPGPHIYRLGRTIHDGGKPVRFDIGHAQVVGPPEGPLFDLRANGSAIIGAGPGATILRLSPPAHIPVAPKVAFSLAAGSVAAANIASPGAHLVTTPLLDVAENPSGDGAAIIATIGNGRIMRVDVVAQGAGYTENPEVTMIGGGECAIRIHEASHCRIAGFTIDLASIPHAVGIFHYGGWYVNAERIDIRESSQHRSAIALLIDSHTLGRPGANGNWGGAYVNRYAQIIAKRCYVVGHDSSTATTLHLDTLDTANLHVHGTIAVLLSNTVLQGSEGAFLDLVNVDGLTMVGGDIEGPATVVRARGTCNNIRLAPLTYSATGPLVHGPIGSGWHIDPGKSNSNAEPLYTGNGGSAGIALQNTGWAEKHRFGIQYSGGSVVFSSNLRMTGPFEGVLDNPDNPGIALILTISGQLILRYTPPGKGRVAVADVAMLDEAGVQLNQLPSTRPPAGSKRVWYDPADDFRVKFQP